MLINLSNHPSANWNAEQKKAAETEFGQIVDLTFPNIQPEADLNDVKNLANQYVIKVKELLKDAPNGSGVVHIMGEHTFIFNILERLKLLNIRAVASTTERKAYEDGNGNTISKFRFVRFRDYY